MSLFRKKPLSKNLCLSFKGKEPVFNSITLYNHFPISLIIISKLDPISSRIDIDNYLSREEIEEQETEISLKYLNEHAKDLFELKEGDNTSKIKEKLKKFKLSEQNNDDNNNNKDEDLYSIIFHQKENTEFYGSFMNKTMFIWVKFIIKQNNIYLCADYLTDERKFIQNELFQSIKYQYIATLFHELYNPINAILVMMEQNKLDDDSRSNLDYQDYDSESEGSHFSLITEDEFDKINYNFNLNENNNDMSVPKNVQENDNLILMKKYEKIKKLEEFYRDNYINMKDKEKDIRLLVNIIYIFLENLILYLRLNLGDGKDNIYGDINTNLSKRYCFSENNSQKPDDENEKDKHKSLNNMENDKIITKSFDKSKIAYKMTNVFTSKLYQDNYLDTGKNNKNINLEIAFRKHLKNFCYLFKVKNIHFFSDFATLSNKYINTNESIFSDFLGQIYSFLYYVVPKFHGFVICFNIVNDNKIKLTFQKENSRMKTGYMTHKKFQKKDSFILLGNRYKASNTVKTTQMTIEILNKLSKILDINLKIMDYEEKTEEKYLTILIPFFLGKDIHNNNEKNRKKSENSNNDSYEGNIIFENTIKNLEKIDVNNLENEKLENIRDKTNQIIENINTKIINTNNNSRVSKKVSFARDNKDNESSINDNGNINNNINSVNINININKNININNNYNSSSMSSYISNTNNNKNSSQKLIADDHTNCSKSKYKKNINDKKNIIKKDKEKNILTLIHEKYSFLDRLKKSGVEILTEKEDKIGEDEYECKICSSEENNNKKINDKSSTYVEADSENFFEIENDSEHENNNDEDASEEIIFNNNYNNINLKIGEDYWNIYKKNNNFVNMNNNHGSSSPSLKSFKNLKNIKHSKDKHNSKLRPKNRYLSCKNVGFYNKTLSYSKSPKDNHLFVIPEISENAQKKRVNPHPSCKLNTKYVNEFTFTECGCHDILLVDDDEFICKTFKNILKKFKLQADCAENGQECLKMIREKKEKQCKCDKNKYKIIFMDITMPVMDGIEAAKNIQKMIDNKEIYDSIKIIFISAHANLDLSSTISGIKCAVDYYAKPITADKYKNLLDKYYYKKINKN